MVQHTRATVSRWSRRGVMVNANTIATAMSSATVTRAMVAVAATPVMGRRCVRGLPVPFVANIGRGAIRSESRRPLYAHYQGGDHPTTGTGVSRTNTGVGVGHLNAGPGEADRGRRH